MTIESRDVHGFEEIAFYAYGDVTIEQAEQEGLSIEADETFLKHIESQVQDDALIIRWKADWLESINQIFMSGLRGSPVRFHIAVKELKALRLYGAASVSISELSVGKFKLLLGGAGSISIDALSGEAFKLELKGAGSVNAAGNVLEQKIIVGGAGSYNGRNLKSETAKVELKGAGSVVVYAEDELEIDLKGLGSVTYYGDPEVKKVIRGLGDISHGGMS
ncbi:MAG: DUF2807 domain-containing protein [Anaerolineales bacterium]|nr:DUF2807 domain-containing protein [Anaerolineales bacterium]